MSKVKVELELVRSTGNYRVKSVVNSLDPKPGDIITAQEASVLIRHCGVRGGSVTIRDAKR